MKRFFSLPAIICISFWVMILMHKAFAQEAIPLELTWLQKAYIAENREQKDEVLNELADRLNIFEIPLAGAGDYVNFNDLPSGDRDFQLKNYDIDGDGASEYIFIAHYAEKPESRLKYFLVMIVKESFDKRWMAIHCDIDLLSSVRAEVNLKTPGLKYFFINKFKDEGNGRIDSRISYYIINDMKLRLLFSYSDYRKGNLGKVNFDMNASRLKVASGVLTIVYNYYFTPLRDSILSFDYFDEMQEKYPQMEEDYKIIAGSDSLMYILNDPQSVNKPFYYEASARERISLLEGRTDKNFAEVFSPELEKAVQASDDKIRKSLISYLLRSALSK